MSKPHEIKASRVFNEDDGLMNTVAFAEDTKGEESEDSYLLIQLAHKFDAKDKELGMDAVYVELNDDFRSVYGGLMGIEMAKGSLLFHFDPDASEELKVDKAIKVALPDGTAQLAETLERLEAIAEKAGIPIAKS